MITTNLNPLRVRPGYAGPAVGQPLRLGREPRAAVGPARKKILIHSTQFPFKNSNI